MEQGVHRGSKYQSKVHKVETTPTKRSPPRGKAPTSSPKKDAHAHLIGFHKDIGKPMYPRDDTVVARGKTPEEKGARPCRHCGSPKHWDNECKHARKGAKRVKAHFAAPSGEYLAAMAAYEDAYLEESEEEPEGDEEPSDEELEEEYGADESNSEN